MVSGPSGCDVDLSLDAHDIAPPMVGLGRFHGSPILILVRYTWSRDRVVSESGQSTCQNEMPISFVSNLRYIGHRKRCS